MKSITLYLGLDVHRDATNIFRRTCSNKAYLASWMICRVLDLSRKFQKDYSERQ